DAKPRVSRDAPANAIANVQSHSRSPTPMRGDDGAVSLGPTDGQPAAPSPALSHSVLGPFPRQLIVLPALSAQARLWRVRPRSNPGSTTFALARANRAAASRWPRPCGYGQPSARSLPAAFQIHLPNERSPALLRSDSDRRGVNFRSSKMYSAPSWRRSKKRRATVVWQVNL